MLSQNTEAHGPEDNFLLVSLKGVSHLSKPTLGSLNLDSEKILSNISQQLEETLAKSHLQTFAEKTYTSSRMFLVPLSPSHVF